MFGPLAPNAAAPLVSLKVTINPAAQVTSITNIAAVEWALFDDPNDTGEASDAVEIAVIAQAQQPPPPPAPPAPAPLPATGSSMVGKVLPLGLTLIGLGLVGNARQPPAPARQLDRVLCRGTATPGRALSSPRR